MLNSHNAYLLKLDEAAIKKELALNLPVFAPKLIHVSNKLATWEVKLGTGAYTYLSMELNRITDYVILVDLRKLHIGWINSSLKFTTVNRDTNCTPLCKIDADYKIAGKSNEFEDKDIKERPMPAPVICLEFNGDDVTLRFKNGVTRTMYLIKNKATSIPIVTTQRVWAEYFAKEYGIDGKFLASDDLIEMKK